MSSEKTNTSKKNNEKKSGKGKKLTAAERRRLERERKAQSLDDDPLAAFNTDGRRPTITPSAAADTENIFGMASFDDSFEKEYGTFDDEPEELPPPPATDDEYNSRPIEPASNLTPRQRTIRRTVSYIAAFFIIVFAAVLLSLTVMFRTTEIKVDAKALPYSDEEIIAASGLTMKDNIFLAKRKAAEKKLVETFPYVEAADVTFRIPGTQIIHIDTAVQSYQVQFTGGYAVVSEQSRILEINDKQKSNIPLLKGLKLDHTKPGEYITFEKASTKQILDEVVKNINENEMPAIYGIDISNTANIELNYDNRITILLGLPEDVGYKLRTAKAIISQSLSNNDKGTLDVSLANTDRRSSYFTPIYSDTASISSSVTQPQQPPESVDGSEQEDQNEYEPTEEQQESGEDEYLEDIIDEEN